MTIDGVVQKPATTVELKIDGVVIGLFLSINDAGEPLVAFPGNPLRNCHRRQRSNCRTKLRTTVGKEVALLFEGGDPRYSH